METLNFDQSLQVPLAISLGAIPGALSRYYLTVLFAQWFGTQYFSVKDQAVLQIEKIRG